MEEEDSELVFSLGVMVLCTYVARYTDVDVEVILLSVTHLASAPPLDEALRIAKTLKLPAIVEEVPEGIRIRWNDDHEMARMGDMTFVRTESMNPFEPPERESAPS